MKPLFTLVLAALLGLSVHSHLITGNIDSKPSNILTPKTNMPAAWTSAQPK